MTASLGLSQHILKAPGCTSYPSTCTSRPGGGSIPATEAPPPPTTRRRCTLGRGNRIIAERISGRNSRPVPDRYPPRRASMGDAESGGTRTRGASVGSSVEPQAPMRGPSHRLQLRHLPLKTGTIRARDPSRRLTPPTRNAAALLRRHAPTQISRRYRGPPLARRRSRRITGSAISPRVRRTQLRSCHRRPRPGPLLTEHVRTRRWALGPTPLPRLGTRSPISVHPAQSASDCPETCAVDPRGRPSLEGEPAVYTDTRFVTCHVREGGPRPSRPIPAAPSNYDCD